MSNSLKDQLLGLGFKAPAPEQKPRPRPQDEPRPRRDDARKPPHAGKPSPSRPPHDKPAHDKSAHDKSARSRPAQGRPPQGKPAAPKTREEMDLAKAYAIRAQREKDERIEAERVRQEEARVRREAKAKLAEFLKDKALNDPAAEIARHFPYGGKIKRVHVTEAQLKALNAGELGVVQDSGRYLLVDAATLAQAEAIFAAAIALKVDPNAPPDEDPYADPRFQVPDDLVW
jgi:uncharacterized protein YaiL (DUF2058 family)